MSSVPHPSFLLSLPSSLFPLLAALHSQRRALICLSGEPQRWQPNTWPLLMFSPGGQFCRSFLFPHLPPSPNLPPSLGIWMDPPHLLHTPPASFGCEAIEAVSESKAETEVEFIAERRVPARAADQLARCRVSESVVVTSL